jgi:hypothetical protein
MEEKIQKGIEIYEKVFGYSEIYSNEEKWLKRNLYDIYFIKNVGFLSIEKRDSTFHIWLMGSIEKGAGTSLFKNIISDLKRENIKEITVSTFPKVWIIMYEWLLRIGFEEYRYVNDKVYLKICSENFINYFI